MQWRLYKEKLLWLRLTNGWSQEEAAFRCDASDKKQYHLWETGKTTRPRMTSLEHIAKAFGLHSNEELILQPNMQATPELAIFYNAHFHQKDPAPISPRPISQNPYKLICFSMDSTLVPSIPLIWKEIWETVGDDEQQRKYALRMFHQKKMTYEEVSIWCCQILKEKGLTKSIIQNIAKKAAFPPNLIKGLKELKKQGYILAIISGTPNTFLETYLPDYNDYFDYVFMNQLNFDNNGKLKSIVPTPFASHTKPDGIRYICNKEGLDANSVVYVGSTFWDQFVYNSVGLSLAYYNPFPGIKEIFDEEIKSKNFSAVVKRIRESEKMTIDA